MDLKIGIPVRHKTPHCRYPTIVHVDCLYSMIISNMRTC